MANSLGDYIVKARAVGCVQGTIQKIEAGQTEHPGIDLIVGIAKALRTDPNSLILAYQGIDPDTYLDPSEKLKEALYRSFVSAFSSEELAGLAAMAKKQEGK